MEVVSGQTLLEVGEEEGGPAGAVVLEVGAEERTVVAASQIEYLLACANCFRGLNFLVWLRIDT